MTTFFFNGQRVRYIPGHAYGDVNHPDCEDGTVSSVKGQIDPDNLPQTVFVKFDKQLRKFGWEGTTSQSCTPSDLVQITPEMKVV